MKQNNQKHNQLWKRKGKKIYNNIKNEWTVTKQKENKSKKCSSIKIDYGNTFLLNADFPKISSHISDLISICTFSEFFLKIVRLLQNLWLYFNSYAH